MDAGGGASPIRWMILVGERGRRRPTVSRRLIPEFQGRVEWSRWTRTRLQARRHRFIPMQPSPIAETIKASDLRRSSDWLFEWA